MSDYSFLGISWIEWVGYAASTLVMISFMMSSIVKLRIINFVGATLFCIYGVLISSYPVAVVNFLIILFNAYYLYKYRKMREEFTIMEISSNSTFMGRFLEMNYDEIRKVFPNFTLDNTIPNVSFYILRDMTVAGLFVATNYNKDTLKITLDYVTPKYRDLKIGNYIHHQLVKYFLAKGYRNLLCETNNPKHIQYLTKMGYTKQTINNQSVYTKTLG